MHCCRECGPRHEMQTRRQTQRFAGKPHGISVLPRFVAPVLHEQRLEESPPLEATTSEPGRRALASRALLPACIQSRRGERGERPEPLRSGRWGALRAEGGPANGESGMVQAVRFRRTVPPVQCHVFLQLSSDGAKGGPCLWSLEPALVDQRLETAGAAEVVEGLLLPGGNLPDDTVRMLAAEGEAFSDQLIQHGPGKWRRFCISCQNRGAGLA